MKLVRLAMGTLAGLGLMTAVAAAHAPIFLVEKVQPGVYQHREIKDPEKSWAIYGRLQPGAGGASPISPRYADVIPIQAEKGQRLFLQLLVPQREELRDFHPVVVLYGPGLTGYHSPEAPIPLEPGVGALTLPRTEPPLPLYEGFTQVHYWVHGTVNTAFPATGQYHLVIYDPAGHGGPYTVALGQREVFGLVDVLTFPLVWARAHVWLWK